jgi:hypothetical protein
VTDVDPAFGNWLAGFIDGEGCFEVSYSGERLPAPRFRMVLRDDDTPIVKEIAARTNIGNVRFQRPRVNAHRAVLWSIDGKRDQQLLVALLDEYPLRAKKRRDYEAWRLAVRAHASVRQGAPAQRAEWRLRELKRQIEDARRYPDDAGRAADDVPDDQLELDL